MNDQASPFYSTVKSKTTPSTQRARMDAKNIIAILSNLKSLVGEEAFNQSIAALPALPKAAGALPSALPKAAPKAAVKAKKPKAEPSDASTEPKAPSAWNVLVTHTVSDMKQNGWTAWTDAKSGIVWPASRPMIVTDKKGQKVSDFVYDGGEHDGKAPSPALGGMVRASFLKGPSAKASAAGSVPSGTASVASEPKKIGRPKMTPEQKEAAVAKRAAKKAAASIDHTAGLSGGWVALASGIDLSFIPWKHDGKNYITNGRGDVINPEDGVWVGRFNGSVIDTTVGEPSDLAEVEMRA